MKKIKPYLPYILVYGVIFLVLFLQHNVVSMYFDDFGNASLSYSSTIENVVGTNFNLSQLFESAIYTYFHFGGRVFYGMIASLLLKNGIKLFMMGQVFVIMGIIYYSSSIVTILTKKKSWMTPILWMILYSLYDITIVRHGNYWASASILYIWSMLPLLALINHYLKTNQKIKKNESVSYGKYIVIEAVLIFLALFSQEQIGVLYISFLFFYIIFDHFKDRKKYLKYDLFSMIFAIIIYAVLFFAPGNWVRMDSNVAFAQKSLPLKIISNIPKLMDLLFKVKTNIYIMIIIALLAIFLGIYIIKNKNKVKWTYFLVFGFIVAFIMYDRELYDNRLLLTLCGVYVLLSMFITFIIYYKEKNNLKMLALPLSAFCSVACLLMAPYMIERSMLPCSMILFLIIICMGYDLFKSNVTSKTLIIIFLVLCTYYGAINYIYIYRGYQRNYATNNENYYKLEHYQIYQKNQTIDLCKVPNSLFGSSQPYEAPYDYWLQQYFDLPENLEMKWRDCNE